RRWWAHSLSAQDDPISLEPLRTLAYPPFQLLADPLLAHATNSDWFDGKVLASYLISTGSFYHPISRRELDRGECEELDRYLREYNLGKPAVTEAFDNKEAYKQADGVPPDSRVYALRAEAEMVLHSLFRASSNRRDERARSSRQRHDDVAVRRDGNMTLVDDDQHPSHAVTIQPSHPATHREAPAPSAATPRGRRELPEPERLDRDAAVDMHQSVPQRVRQPLRSRSEQMTPQACNIPVVSSISCDTSALSSAPRNEQALSSAPRNSPDAFSPLHNVPAISTTCNDASLSSAPTERVSSRPRSGNASRAEEAWVGQDAESFPALSTERPVSRGSVADSQCLTTPCNTRTRVCGRLLSPPFAHRRQPSRLPRFALPRLPCQRWPPHPPLPPPTNFVPCRDGSTYE
ncbi:MAG: hypothetical protein SGPRY_010402, partial [Prymnesium sp.]